MSAPSTWPRHQQTFLPKTKKMAIHFWFHKHFCKVLHIMWRCCCGVVLACEINSLLFYSFPLIQRCWTYNLRSHQVMQDATLFMWALSDCFIFNQSCSLQFSRIMATNSILMWKQQQKNPTTQKLNLTVSLRLLSLTLKTFSWNSKNKRL